MEPVLLLYDVSYQCHRAAHAHPGLTCDGTFTGGLYGFFQTLGKIVRETQATHAAFCLDSPPYRRSEAYPRYKQVRKKAEDPEVRARVDLTKRLVRETLEGCGANVYALGGFESDDLIAAMARRNRHRFGMIYAASNDSDLWQHLGQPNFALYKTDIASVVTLSTLDEMGLTPEQYMHATALMGTHNDVEGIAGVGPKTAYAAVKDPAKLRQLRSKHAETIDRNLSLIRLPHPELPAQAGVLDARRAFDPRSLYAGLGRYDIDVTHAMVSAMTRIAGRQP